MINSNAPLYISFLMKFREKYGCILQPTEREYEW